MTYGFDAGAFQYQSSVRVTDSDKTEVVSGDTLIITGYGFGATQGASEVYITDDPSDISAGHTQSIVSWSDTSITITVDSDVPIFGFGFNDAYFTVAVDGVAHGPETSTQPAIVAKGTEVLYEDYPNHATIEPLWDWYKDTGDGSLDPASLSTGNSNGNWSFDPTGTPSRGYGPTAPPDGKSGYFYVETSAVTDGGTRWSCEKLAAFNSTGKDTIIAFTAWFTFNYSMRIYLGVRKNGSGDPWTDTLITEGSYPGGGWQKIAQNITIPSTDGDYDVRFVADVNGNTTDLWQADPAWADFTILQTDSVGGGSAPVMTLGAFAA